MSRFTDLQDGTERRLIEAAAWRLRLTDDGATSSPEFETWLREPANQVAWNQVSGPWAFFDEVAHAPEMVAARQGVAQRTQLVALAEMNLRMARERYLEGVASILEIVDGESALQMAHIELGREVLDRVAQELKDIGKIEQEPKLEGRNMSMVLAPK